MRKYLFPVPILMLLLSACGGRTTQLPPLNELWYAIQTEVSLSYMIDVGNNYLESLTGIRPKQYEQAMCLLLTEGTAPDEIILVRAVDENAAQDVQQKLQDRLDYKNRSVQQYLIEYQPMVAEGVVRRDGLVVSLIVSAQVDEIIQVYAGLIG